VGVKECGAKGEGEGGGIMGGVGSGRVERERVEGMGDKIKDEGGINGGKERGG